MILDQTDTPDGYAQAYDPAYLLPEVQGWWPKGFDKVDTDQLRGLLDEMAGLGVLVRSVSGSYRLRSPNLVRLFGTEADIENRLLALSYEEPDQPFDADSHHALLGEQEQRYSPLTYAQERRLNTARFGVGLVFASDALGLRHIETAFRRFIPADLPTAKGAYKEIPPTEIDGTGLEIWLREYLASHKNHERLILYSSFRRTNAALFETIKVAHKVCHAHQRSKKRWLRILFVFDPESTWHWLSLPIQQRQKIEDQADVSTFLRRWDHSGIRQRLNQLDKIYSDEVCRTVLEATGGWPWLLDTLFEHCATEDDPRPAAKTIEQELRNPHSSLSQDFKRALGLNENDVIGRVLEFIKTLGGGQEVPANWVAPENVDGSPILSQNECYAAIEYLQRLGCIDRHGDLLSVEPAVLHLL